MKMPDKKRVKLEGGVKISQKAFEKLRKNAVDDSHKDMLRNVVKKEFECSGCKNLPRPGQTTIKKCKPCSKIFCGICGSHQCSDGSQRNPEMSIPLTINLEFLPFFCKNNKFGCQEILFKKKKLFEHEHVCEFQLTYCADSLCKSKVNVLNYLDHYREEHGNHDDLGVGKTFKLPLPIDQIQTQNLQVILRNDVLAIKASYPGLYQLSSIVNGKLLGLAVLMLFGTMMNVSLGTLGLRLSLDKIRPLFAHPKPLEDLMIAATNGNITMKVGNG